MSPTNPVAADAVSVVPTVKALAIVTPDASAVKRVTGVLRAVLAAVLSLVAMMTEAAPLPVLSPLLIVRLPPAWLVCPVVPFGPLRVCARGVPLAASMPRRMEAAPAREMKVSDAPEAFEELDIAK